MHKKVNLLSLRVSVLCFILSVFHPLLVDPSIEAARNWKFKPAMINGGAVKVWMNIPIDFKLRKSN